MTAAKGHTVVVVPRGDGYAARCEVERDGVTQLCGITFGGFRTKTEARAALAHEEAPASAATEDEGEDQTNQQKEDQIVNTIIPDTEEARQMVREWAKKLAQWPYSEHFDADEVPAPDWPKALTPWWVERVDVTFAGGGEAVVDLSRDCGEVSLGTLLTVIVTDEEGWVRKHPGSTVGDYSELDSGIEITITGPHEGMDLVEAGNVFDSLAAAIALLRQIQSGVR